MQGTLCRVRGGCGCVWATRCPWGGRTSPTWHCQRLRFPMGGRAGEEEEGPESERNMPSSHANSPETFQLLEYRGALICSE